MFTHTLWIVIVLLASVSVLADTTSDLRSLIHRTKLNPVKKPAGMQRELYFLGRQLFFEKNISGNRDISCATCHSERAGLGDRLPLSLGTGFARLAGHRVKSNNSVILARNSPSLFNIGDTALTAMFWDGRVMYDPLVKEIYSPAPGLNGPNPKLKYITDQLDSALAVQSMFPMLSSAEMLGRLGSNEIANAKSREEAWGRIVVRLFAMKKYQNLFPRAYPGRDINIGHIAKALAHYQKFRFSVYQTPWDEFLRGNDTALSDLEKRGAIAFIGKGRCVACHGGRLLGGTSFHNVVSPQIGPGIDREKNDEGRFYVTKRDSDRYKFKTPMLRNLKYTAPYFHSGAYQSIDEVIEHYTKGANAVDTYDSSWLTWFEQNIYGRRIFVETDRYKNFRKKEGAHPFMKSKAIRLSPAEKVALKSFLLNSLSQD